VDLIKRSTADTGGTPTTVTPAKMDGSDGVALAQVKEFAAAPSPLGTSIGTILATSFALAPNTVAGGYSTAAVWPMADPTYKPLILNGANEFLCINLAGIATTTADRLDLEAIFTEG